jgi:hypothetical protein
MIAAQRMGPAYWGDKFFVDHRDGGGRFSVVFGPVDTLQEAVQYFKALAGNRQLRVRGPENSFHAESYRGTLTYHDPPKRIRP